MIFATQLGHTQLGYYETTEIEELAGIVEIVNAPPENLECPNSDSILQYDLFLVDSDDPDPEHWIGCQAKWDNHTWEIIEVRARLLQRRTLKLQSPRHYDVYIERVDER